MYPQFMAVLSHTAGSVKQKEICAVGVVGVVVHVMVLIDCMARRKKHCETDES